MEVSAITEQGKGQNVDLAYTTVKDAFDALGQERECFTHHGGSRSKSGNNLRLEIDARTAAASLVESSQDDTGAHSTSRSLKP